MSNSNSSSNSGSSSISSGGSAGTEEIATVTSRPPRYVCWKDPVDFRSHPVSVLVTTIIDR